MQFATLGSGSSGNATLIRAGAQCILLDCGFTLREFERRLLALETDASSITAVLVTHEHGDHCRGVGALARKYQLPVYMTPGTHLSSKFGRLPRLHLLEGYESFAIGDITVQPVAVPHDAREPAQFVFMCGKFKLGVLTDLGFITPHVVAAYNLCDGLILEANHDTQMLATGPYPQSLKRRVGGEWGHLSNTQAAAFLEMIQLHRVQHLVLGHISTKNNCVERVRGAIEHIPMAQDALYLAAQDVVSPWFVINSNNVP